MKKMSSGQTIIEIIIATGIVAIVLVAVMMGLTFSLKNTAQSKYQSLASKLAQEGMEAFRRERDALGFVSFRDQLTSPTYCLPTIPNQLALFSAGACDEAEGITLSGVTFYREAEINTGASVTEPVEVKIVVSWLDGTQEHQTFATQQFTDW